MLAMILALPRITRLVLCALALCSLAASQTPAVLSWEDGLEASFEAAWTTCERGALPGAALCLNQDGGALNLFEASPGRDYSVTAEVVLDDDRGGAAVVARASEDRNNLYQLELIELDGQKVWQFVKRVNGDWSLVERGAFDYQPGTPYLLRFTLSGDTLTGEVSTDIGSESPNWTVLGSARDSSVTEGRAGLKLIQANAAFGDVRLDAASAVAEAPSEGAAIAPGTDTEAILEAELAAMRAESEGVAPASSAATGGPSPSDLPSPLELPGTKLFVSPDGDDANPGTEAAPFRTVQRCADEVSSGGACILRQGVYRETVTPPRGGDVSLPVTFASYPGERATISGADVLSGFSQQDGLQVVDVGWDLGQGANQLFIDGEMQYEARWPNMADAPISQPNKAAIVSAEERSRQTYIVNLESAPPQEIQGAKANLGLSNQPDGHEWLYDSAIIEEVNGTRLRVTAVDGDLYRPVDPDNDLFLWGHPALIDESGEWYLDADSSQLRLQYGDLTGATVEFKRREFAFDLRGRSNINVQNVDIFASTVITDEGSSRITLDGLDVRYPSHQTLITGVPDYSVWNAAAKTGVMLFGSENTIRNSNIAYSAGNGILLDGQNHLVENNIVHDVNYLGSDAAALTTRCSVCNNASYGHRIRYNTMFNVGRSIIVHRNTGNIRIEYNNLYNGGLQSDDNGLTYTFQTNGDGTVIAYNVVHDSFSTFDGIGIYIDNGSSNFIVHNNIVYDVDQALKLNLPSENNKIYNNTLLGDSASVTSWGPDYLSRSMAGTVIRNNIMPTSTSFISQDGLVLENNFTDGDPGFVNPAEANFQLREGSPAIDAGGADGEVQIVSVGSAPDLGAVEFGQPAWAYGAQRGE